MNSDAGSTIDRQSGKAKWAHLAFTQDGRFYVDGRMVPITQPANASFDTGDYNGSIDEIKVYNRNLSEAEADIWLEEAFSIFQEINIMQLQLVEIF